MISSRSFIVLFTSSLLLLASSAAAQIPPPVKLKDATLTQADSRFQKLIDTARPLEEGLSTFLDKYVGDCTDPLESRQCEAHAKAFRDSTTGHRFWFIVSDDAVSQLSPGPYDPRGHYVLNLLPFFPAAGYALTQGAPKRTDARGNPIVPLIVLRGDSPSDWIGTTLPRLVQTQAFKIQVVFTPQGIWSLPKPGGGKSKGVAARIHGLRVTIARTGQVLNEWYER